MTDAGEHWCIMIRPERRPVPAINRLRGWLKCGKRSYGIICTMLDLPAEVRQLQLRLALLTEENDHLRKLVHSLAARCAGQAELLEARANEGDTTDNPRAAAMLNQGSR
jgi:hypothetical protein